VVDVRFLPAWERPASGWIWPAGDDGQVGEDARTATTPRTIFSGPLRTTSSGILVLITFVAFEAMAVAVALPSAARDLRGLEQFGWAFTGFLAANVLGMVASGEVSDRRGPRLPLVVGVAAFLTGLLLAGTATTMLQLVVGRVVQGLGGGILITAVYVVIGTEYPESLRPKFFAALATAWVLPSLIGPIVAGAMTEHLGWRSVFLALVPMVVAGAVLMVPVLRSLTRLSAEPPARVDTGRIGHAGAVAVGVSALAHAGQSPSPVSVAAGAVGLVAMAWGLRVLLPAGTFQVRRGVSAPVAMRGLFAGAFFGMESIVPLSMSQQHGYGPLAAGLPLACGGVAWAVGSWWQGRDASGDEQERRVRLVRVGFTLVTACALAVAFAAHPWAPGWLIYPAWAAGGLGAGMAMTTANVLLLRYTNDADRGADSAALQLSDATSSALTTGVAGLLVAAAVRGSLGYTTAFVTLGLAMAAVAFVGVLLAGRVRAPAR
jgi:MFS family permease